MTTSLSPKPSTMTWERPSGRDLLDDLGGPFPTTRYQGSKAKLCEWIWERLRELEFHTCLDAFGGTGAVAYRLKRAGKRVTYNDALRFNYHFGRALIENGSARVTEAEVERILAGADDHPGFISETFRGIYYTDAENAWLDRTIAAIRRLRAPYHFDLAFFALAQASLIKRPYNLFHRKNLYLRLARVPRSFGNKASWDRPFADWFRRFLGEANAAVFDNGEPNRALSLDAAAVPGDYDLVYLDPPYLPGRGAGVDYRGYYHFLEGLADYENWSGRIDRNSKHLRLAPAPGAWDGRRTVHAAFARVFERFEASVIALSYRSDGVPAPDELAAMLKRHKRRVRVHEFGPYNYALSTRAGTKELLFIGT